MSIFDSINSPLNPSPLSYTVFSYPGWTREARGAISRRLREYPGEKPQSVSDQPKQWSTRLEKPSGVYIFLKNYQPPNTFENVFFSPEICYTEVKSFDEKQTLTKY